MKSNQQHLLCVASVDFPDISDGDPPNGDGLFADAVLAEPEGWAGLQEAAKSREEDDREFYGYVLKAWSINPLTGAAIDSEQWLDLCSDQVERVYSCLALMRAGHKSPLEWLETP